VKAGADLVGLLGVLPPRAIHVLDLTCRGFSQKQIAHELGISERTVQTYARTIRIRLECRTLTQAAVMFALQQMRSAGRTDYGFLEVAKPND